MFLLVLLYVGKAARKHHPFFCGKMVGRIIDEFLEQFCQDIGGSLAEEIPVRFVQQFDEVQVVLVNLRYADKKTILPYKNRHFLLHF
jgi:hypothetical protein